jgi:hypothetical protein
MEQNKPNIKPAPALPEAIHPEIGNGAAWEERLHEQLLRNPDSSKQLDHLLILDHLQLRESLQPEANLVAEETKPEHSMPASKKIEDPYHNLIHEIFEGDTHEQLEAYSKHDPKAKKKAKSKKDGKAKQEENPDWLKDIPEEEKSSQAGKLVRKAAKSVKRQEKEQIKVRETKSLLRNLNFHLHRWLKGFSGSDYVHPMKMILPLPRVWSFREGITETFADLLAAQFYKEQEIEMYIKLMEKYPEKSGFFAAKIEALQQ